MINFFRKIRKKLADDNKPLKYMRYAIAEIVLVVIGILFHYESPLGMSVKKLVMNQWNISYKITYIYKQPKTRVYESSS